MDDLRIFSADPDADASTVKIDHDSDTDASTVTINAVSGTDAAAQMSNISSDADAATVKINTASGTNAPTVKWRVVPALIGLVLALGLALFTVLVFQVRKSNEFLFSTHYERVLTIIETVVYFAFFIFAWKALDLFDRFAAAGESAGEDVIGGKASHAGGSEQNARPAALKKHFLMSWNPGSVLVTFLLLFVLFLPYMYVYYPQAGDEFDDLKHVSEDDEEPAYQAHVTECILPGIARKASNDPDDETMDDVVIRAVVRLEKTENESV